MLDFAGLESGVKRSEINQLVLNATAAFQAAGWALPPHPRWDVTDFGLGDWTQFGLVLVNLADEPEYCEKLMYAEAGMVTPAHAHRIKKEDIIARRGTLRIRVWADATLGETGIVHLKRNGEPLTVPSGTELELSDGERVTLPTGVYHAFEPVTAHCVIGEVSTANDDLHDNDFVDPEVGRYTVIEEDVEATVRLVSDRPA